jgi:hypothetical protein
MQENIFALDIRSAGLVFPKQTVFLFIFPLEVSPVPREIA